MSKAFFKSWILVCVWCGIVLASSEKDGSEGLPVAIDTIYALSNVLSVSLSHGLVIPASVSPLNFSDTLIKEIDAFHGELYFKRRVDLDTLIVRYRYLPLEIRNYYQASKELPVWNPEESNSVKLGIQRGQKDESRGQVFEDRRPDFLQSGTIFRGITIGTNSSISLQSGLDLRLGGNLGDGIRLEGVLSDQNYPLQPEGNTQRLDEVDRVYIRVLSPSGDLVLGDNEVEIQQGELLRFNRKIKGINGRYHGSQLGLGLSGAITRGEYGSNRFQGVEGKQGPYILTGKNGNTEIIVLAGTEKVWINGVLQKRGEKYDYTIDYSLGEIYFTPDRPITSDMRIVVDFQYSDLAYNRNILTLQGGFSPDERLSFNTAFIHEGDNPGQPIDLRLSQSDKKYLKGLGDNEAEAFISTAVKDSSGDYVLEDGIFRYVGAGQGDYRVSFYHVGIRGTYRKVYSGEGFYFEYVDTSDTTLEWEVREQATYLPARPLKLPVSSNYYYLSSGFQSPSGLELSGEALISEQDRNLFSPLDDGDNRGSGYRLSGRMEKELRPDIILRLENGIRYFSSNLVLPERVDDVEDSRNWGREQGGFKEKGRLTGLAELRWRDRLQLQLSAGSLSSYDDFSSVRREVKANYSGDKLQQVNLFYLNTNYQDEDTRRNAFLRLGGSLHWSLRRWYPYFRYLQEEKEVPLSSGYRYRESESGITYKSALFTMKLSTIGRSNYKTIQQIETKDYQSRQYTVGTALQGFKGIYTGFNYTLLTRKVWQDSLARREQFHNLDFSVTRKTFNSPWRWDISAWLREEKTPRLEYRYFKVQEGYGNFRYDSLYADFVPDQRGEYILRVFPSDILESVTSFRNDLKFYYRSRRKKGGNLWQRLISNRSVLNISLHQEWKDRRSFDQLKLNRLFIYPADDSTLFDFRKIIQSDLFYYFIPGKNYLRFSFQDNLSYSHADVRGFEKNRTQKQKLTLKHSLSRSFSLESSITMNRIRRSSAYNSFRNRNLSGVEFSQVISLLRTGQKNSLNLTYGRDRNNLQIFQQRSQWYGAEFSQERWWTGKGRGKVFLRVNYVDGDEGIPYEMAGGLQPGWNFRWGVNLNYRLYQNVFLIINYQGWKDRLMDTFHQGRVELRANF